jgi:2-desacetyl-2-hydroxyethyl bacteriochlorophyllide A dehydrogenase
MEEPYKIVFHKAFDLQYEKINVDGLFVDDESVLIRTRYSLISPGTELALYTGTHINLFNSKDTFAKYPFYPGYASVGEVVRIGKNVKDLKIGDRVFAISNHAAYNVVHCSSGSIFKLPKEFSEIKALFARLAAISMTSVIQSDLKIGDRVMILGMGLIGNLAAQLFSIQGAYCIGVDTIAERIKIAESTIINHVVLCDAETDLLKELHKISDDLIPDIVVEATGNASLVNTALKMVRPRGQVVLLGSPRSTLEVNVYEDIHRKGIRFTGAHEILQGVDDLPNRATLLQYMLQLIERGALHIDPLITNVVSALNAKEAYELLLNKKESTLGVILNWQ